MVFVSCNSIRRENENVQSAEEVNSVRSLQTCSSDYYNKVGVAKISNYGNSLVIFNGMKICEVQIYFNDEIDRFKFCYDKISLLSNGKIKVKFDSETSVYRFSKNTVNKLSDCTDANKPVAGKNYTSEYIYIFILLER